MKRTPLFRAFLAVESQLSWMSDISCTNCEWYGSADEMEEFKDFHKCPECDHTYENYTLSSPPQSRDPITQAEMKEFMWSLMDLALEFNLVAGHCSWRDTQRPQLYNTMIEIDMHGLMTFRVLEWADFKRHQNVGGADYYRCDGKDIEIMRPQDFDTSEFRDRLNEFYQIIRKVETFIENQEENNDSK